MKPALSVLLTAAMFASSAAIAQQPMPVIAVPPLTTPDDKSTGAGSTLNVAWQASQLIAQDLRSTGEMMAIPPSQKDYYSYPEVTAPSFARWRQSGAKALLAGFVRAQSDGRLAVGCYVYDVENGRELGRIGFAVAADDWRRAAHKCSGLAYQSLTGSPGIFDTRIAYVARTGGNGAAEVTRIAVMDGDGLNHNYVTPGGAMALTPRLSPKGDRLAYVSYIGGRPNVRIVDIDSGEQRPLIPGDAMSFAPRYSPDGTRIAFSMMTGGNSDIYLVGANGGIPQRLTGSPGIDTDPSFSPDGRKILFESDRSGTQQLYVMNADGSDQRRISFGGGWYGSPAWSPDGEKIAFTRRGADGLRIGVMNADGSDQRVLTTGPRDEGANWAASSRELIFQRTDAYQRSGVYRLALSGGEPRKVQIPQEGSDPDWSGARD
jgi:TolB protein